MRASSVAEFAAKQRSLVSGRVNVARMMRAGVLCAFGFTGVQCAGAERQKSRGKHLTL